MEIKKLNSFLEELELLEEKHGIYIGSDVYVEHDYDYSGELTRQMEYSHIILNYKGHKVPVEDIESGTIQCLYCGRINQETFFL